MNRNQLPPVKIAVVDDHHLFRNGLCCLIRSFGHEYEIAAEASGADELLLRLAKGEIVDIALMDVTRHQSDGMQMMQRIKDGYPAIRVIGLTKQDDERTLMRMVAAGAYGYLVKDVEPAELRMAIDSVADGKFYYNNQFTGRLIHSLQNQPAKHPQPLKDHERRFLELACTELTYKEIAEKMFVNVKTIEGYSATLFRRYSVRSRVGLVLYAIRNKLVDL